MKSLALSRHARICLSFVLTVFFQYQVSAQNISTIVGTGAATFTGDGGPALSASINVAWGVAVDTAGNVYIGDGSNNRIRKINTAGVITTIGGTGPATYGGDGGLATAAQLNFPSGVDVDTFGNIYISDANNHRVRKITATGIISTIAGTGIAGFSGDGGLATAARIVFSDGICVDDAGNVFIPDPSNHRIRKVNTSGIITTYAGTGVGGYTGDGGLAVSANIDYPSDIDADASGNIYFTDFQRHVVRKITPAGIITTVAGNSIPGFSGDGGAATLAKLYYPTGIDVDACGNIYISDRTNNRIRVVNSDGTIATVAGNGIAGFSGDGGPATTAKISNPHGLCHDAKGNIYILDRDNYRVRKVKLINRAPYFTGGLSQTLTICEGTVAAPINTLLAVIDSDVNQPESWTVYTPPVNGTLGGFAATGTSNTGTITPTGLSYTPAVGYSGSDSFSVIIADCKTADTIEIYVTITPSAPIGAITGPTSVCVGSTISLADTSASGTWSVSNTHATVSGGVVTGVSAGTDTVYYTVTGGCGSSTVSYVITINPAPAVGAITGPTNVCTGTSITLSCTPTGGTWSVSNTNATINSSGVLSAVVVGLDTVAYTNTTACGSARATLVITIDPTPSVNPISGLSDVCVGAAIILTETSTGGAWYASNSHATVSGGIVTGASAGLDTIGYYITNSCGSDTAFQIVSVHAAPAIPSTSATICSGSSTTLTASGAGSYTWSPAGTLSSSTGATVTATPSGSIVYTITGSTAFGCTGTATATVIVSPVPPAPVVASPLNYCHNAVATPLTAAGTALLWYTSATGGIGSAAAPTVNTAIPGTYTYWVSQTTGGCEGPRASITATVQNTIAPGFGYTLHLGCTDDTVVFSNTSSGGSTYVWNFGDAYSSTAANPTHIYMLQGLYTVKLFVYNNTCMDSSVQVIDLRHTDSAAFSVTPTVLCKGTPNTFTNLSVATSPVYLWMFGDGSTSTAVNPAHTYSAVDTYTVALIVSDLVPCSDTAYSMIIVDSSGSVELSVSDSVICAGTYINMLATYLGGSTTTLTWRMGNGDSILNANPVLYAYQSAGVYSLTVSAIFRACPAVSVSKTITVLPSPLLNLGPDTTICAGNEEIILTNHIYSGAGATWTWNTGEITPSIVAIGPGTYIATVRINNCATVDTINVTNSCSHEFPNVFTPNGDGLNDYFDPRDFLGKGLISFEMSIYNRWGEVIFNTDKTTGNGWDGRYNDIMQPVGVFIYRVSARFADGQRFSKNGNVTLLK